MSFQPDNTYQWFDATSASAQPILLQNRQAYQCQGSPSDPPIVFRLPPTMLKGYNAKIVGNGRHFRVTQNSNQQMHQGPSYSTVGATGYIESTSPNDAAQIQCTLANTQFCVHSTQGTINLV